MRFEVHQRNLILVYLAAVQSGVALEGLSPILHLQRVSDGQYWNSDLEVWDGDAFDVEMSEVQPGLYSFSLPMSAGDSVLESQGYIARISEDTTPLLEYVRIEVRDTVVTMIPSAVKLSGVPPVQDGFNTPIRIMASTTPPTFGRSSGLTLSSVKLTTSTGMEVVEYDTEWEGRFIELATRTAVSSPVVDAPELVSNGYDLTVQNALVFAVGDFVGTDDSRGVYEVVDISGSVITVHATENGFDIEDGDTLYKVNPTGVYTTLIQANLYDLMSAGNPSGTLFIEANVNATGASVPGFPQAGKLQWTGVASMDFSGRSFRAG